MAYARTARNLIDYANKAWNLDGLCIHMTEIWCTVHARPGLCLFTMEIRWAMHKQPEKSDGISTHRMEIQWTQPVDPLLAPISGSCSWCNPKCLCTINKKHWYISNKQIPGRNNVMNGGMLIRLCEGRFRNSRSGWVVLDYVSGVNKQESTYNLR